jgi:hypothetical protein
VSEAGTATVNGDYEKTSFTTSTGGEVWKHLTANCYLYNLDGYWCINLNNYATWGESSYYYTYNSDLTQWNVGYNWTDELPTGASPAPSVSRVQVTLDADVPKTWDGYKAILADGVYDFEKTLTTGMSYGTSYVPSVGGIYSADALVQVAGLFDNIVNNFPGSASLFALDANVGINDLVGGGAPTLVGSGTVLQNGEFCFDTVRAFDYSIGKSMSDLKEFTIEMDYTITSDATGFLGFFGNKHSWSTMCVCMQWGRSGYRPAMFWNDYFDTNTGGAEHPEWVNDGKYHHVAMVKKGDVVTLYSDGVKIAQYSGATKSLNLAIENLLAVGTQHVENEIFPGRMKHFRVIGSAIYDGDFDVPDWVGKGSGSGNGDSGSGDGKTYVYTVSGAGTAAANGNYWDTGETNYDYPICTNGNYYLYFFGGDEWWVMDDVMNAPPFAYHCSVMNVAPNEGSWSVESGASPAPTITKYSGGGSGGVVNTYRISGCPSPAYDGNYQLTQQTSTLCTMIYKKVGDTEKHLVKTTKGQWIVGFYDPEGGYDSDAYLGQYRINSDDPVNGVWFDDAMGDDCPGMSCTVIN